MVYEMKRGSAEADPLSVGVVEPALEIELRGQMNDGLFSRKGTAESDPCSTACF
jgi:hypothetical protein